MGKTGSIEWVQIKGRKGQTRLVPKRDAAAKRPGPAQRYDSSGRIRRQIKRSEKAILGSKAKPARRPVESTESTE
ncbi:MAG: DUF5350 domain-containing protein [Methanosarcinales archaeon]|jgi:hypothetical protein|nr:MAG: DUF5350 domain-containing protein [Methanosarcinales archaeon]